jgi:hypothetical protein
MLWSLIALQFAFALSFMFLPSRFTQWGAKISLAYGMQVLTAVSLIAKVTFQAPPRRRLRKGLDVLLVAIWMAASALLDLIMSGALDALGGPNM